jgi:broad specificity phosphatase PhoE
MNHWYDAGMPRDHASLQRQPFLIPIWLTVAGGLLAMSILTCVVWVWATADSTTVIVVRHAEKALDGGADPPLTPAGEARAASLARMFGDVPKNMRIDAIYVSAALRNRLTAAPLAARLELVPVVAPPDPRGLARRVLREHAGGRVLIVGHSDTVPDIVEALSGVEDVPPMGDQEYDTLYLVSVPRIGRANLLRVHY